LQEGKRRQPATQCPFNGHAQADPDATQVGHKHPEDHAVHENGVGGQVRAR